MPMNRVLFQEGLPMRESSGGTGRTICARRRWSGTHRRARIKVHLGGAQSLAEHPCRAFVPLHRAQQHVALGDEHGAQALG